MSGNTSNPCHPHTRRRDFREEVTVQYPEGFPQWNDETTVTVDPAEMLLTAQAMMFVDTGVIELPELRAKKQPPPIRERSAITKSPPIAKPPATPNRRQRGTKRRTRQAS